MEKIESKCLDLTKLNIEKLKELFPNVVTENKIDFDMLRLVLGDEIDDSKEKYQFTWHGKSEAIKLAQSPSSATLRPDKESSKNWDTTKNLYIEGDNLEVLKQLQKTYYGKIKMIYIDPPYNTGKDFIYKDNYKDSIKNYLEQTNQENQSNPDSSGSYHSNWLNMMYPRLLIARNLLSNNGAIFISMDDDEIENLKKICNDIFGESNFVETFIWKKLYGGKNDSQWFSHYHDYILVYAKNKSSWFPNLLPRSDKQNDRYKNPDNDPRGSWTSADFSQFGPTPNCVYEIVTPNGTVYTPKEGKRWITTKDSYLKLRDEGRLWFGSDGGNMPRIKRYLSEVKQGVNQSSFLDYTEVGHSDEANKEVKELLQGKYFDYPKPVRLLKRLSYLGSSKDDIILDFFSGSATTAHAVMKLNAEDGGNRKFIMVQLPEVCNEKSDAYKAGYSNICEIGKERIRRAGEQIKAEWDNEHPQDTLLSTDEKFSTDIGFKVFKLDSTNIKPWDNENELDEKNIFDYGDVFKEDRSKEDILYEIMLKYGVFDMPTSEVVINGKTMYRVGKRYMIVCLEDEITSDDVRAIAELRPKTVVFKEAGFKNDNDKINAEYNLEKAGVEDIKCI